MQQEKLFTLADLRIVFYEAIYIANPALMPPSKKLEFKFERIAEQLEARRLALDANPDDYFFAIERHRDRDRANNPSFCRMNLTELSKSIHEGNKARGFYDQPPSFPDRCLLIMSEIADAVDAHRNSNTTEKNDIHKACKMAEIDMLIFTGFFRANVKDTVEDELADAVIRLLDLAGYMEIDIDAHIRAKLAFNATRGTRHGKAY
jgi:NTP pyrophosphatase (non-canonical NTP hydrolase)